MHNLQESPHFGVAATTVSKHIASNVLGWHLGEPPELGQDIFSVIPARKVIENHSSCPALYS